MGKVGFHIRLEPELHARIKDMSDDLEVSMNQLVHDVLNDFFYLDKMYVARIYKRTMGEDTTWEFVSSRSLGDD